MVQDIVERVAEALHAFAPLEDQETDLDGRPVGQPYPLTWEGLCGGYPGTAESYRGLARAAILEALQAMREPSEVMKVAGGLKCEAIMFENEGSGVIFNDMGLVFTAMIDAQIKEMEEAGC